VLPLPTLEYSPNGSCNLKSSAYCDQILVVPKDRFKVKD